MRLNRYCPIFVLTFALAACGHGKAPAGETTAPEAEAQAQAQPSPPPPAAVATDPSAQAQANTTRPLQVSDLDAYVKGMQKEIELRQASSDKAAKAAHDQETEVAALADMTSAEVDHAGAQAADLDAARYDFVKHAVDKVLSTIAMSNAMAKMEGGAQLQQRQGDPYAGLSADVAAALKSRQAELGKLREDNMAILVNAQNL